MASKGFNRFWEEVKRRNLPRVATVYAISSWVIIQVASTVFPPLRIPDWVLPLIIVLILIGFPVVLILAWVFEFSPNAPASEKIIHVDDDLYPRKRVLTSNVAITLLVLIVIGQFIYFNISSDSNKEETAFAKSVAVIPFDNLTNDVEMESFCDGMTEEIINHLSKIASLKVTSRTSVKSFKKTQASVMEIATKLTVNHILVGSIRKSGSRIRISAQLIDAKTDKTIWSDDYDYLELKDIFSVQTDVSSKVAVALKTKLTQQEKASLSKNYTENVKAYQYYLKGRNFWDKRTKEFYDSAEANFHKAIDLDPQYALAYTGLADCYIHSNFKGLTQVEAVPIAKVYVQKALEIDPTLCEALTDLGFIQSHFEYEWEEGKKTLLRAIQYNPNYPIAHLYLSNILIFNGDKAGMKEIKKAIELDPLSETINFALGRAYFCAGDLDQAIIQLRKSLKLNPNFVLSKTSLIWVYLEKRDFRNAEKIIDDLPDRPFLVEYKGLFLALLQAMTGYKKESKATLQNAINTYEGISNYRVAQTWVILGDLDKAFQSLDRSFEQHEITMILLNVDRFFIPNKNDPRFRDLIKKMNFSQQGFSILAQ